MKISELFNTYGSDKASGVIGDPAAGHLFGEKYDEIFSKFDKNKSCNILEIGIQKAGCLKAIRDFLPKSNLWGVDIYDQVLPQYRLTENIEYIIDDIKNDEVFNKLKNIKFDLIIDDGSHHINDVQFVVDKYKDLLSDDGIMVIEDVQSPPDWVGILENCIKDEPFSLTYIDYRHINTRYDDFLIFIKRS